MASNPTKLTLLENDQQLRDLAAAFEDERLNAENLAQQSSGDVILQDGTDTGNPSALVLQQLAAGHASDAETAKNAAESAESDAQQAASDAQNSADDALKSSSFVAVVDTESDLSSISSPSSGDQALVRDDTANNNGTEAIYEYDGSSWNFTGHSLLSHGELGVPNGAASLDGTGRMPLGQSQGIESVSTISALQSLEPKGNRHAVSVESQWKREASAGGTWVWDPSLSASDHDGVQIVESTVSGYAAGDTNEGAWRRTFGRPEIMGHGEPNICLQFDDGYESNFTRALPIFRKYGLVGTIFVETEEINSSDYLKIDQLRQLIDEGWEITHHAGVDTTLSDDQIYQNQRDQNNLLVDLLTGKKTIDSNGTVTDTGTTDYPRFNDYEIKTTSYRGGQRDDEADKALRVLYDKVRTIPGSVADRGDHLKMKTTTWQEATQMDSAIAADTSAAALGAVLNYVRSVVKNNGKLSLYFHDVLEGSTDTSGASPPAINEDELEAICREIYRLGATASTYDRFATGSHLRGNGVEDKEVSALSDGANSSVAEYDTNTTLYSLPRSIRLYADGAYAGSNTPEVSFADFACEPLTRYRIRVIYKIDSAFSDAPSNGGSGFNGLELTLNTFAGNNPKDKVGNDSTRRIWRNDNSKNLIAEATSGFVEYETVLVTGPGSEARVSAQIIGTSGEVWIGAVNVEKLDSIISNPLSGTASFNTRIARDIYLPDIARGKSTTKAHRAIEWELHAHVDPIQVGKTVEYAYEDSSKISSPSSGEQAYVLGAGANAFSGDGGHIYEWDGSSWVDQGSVSDRTLVHATDNAQGKQNRFFFHHANPSQSDEAMVEEVYTEVYEAQPQIGRNGADQFEVWDPLGSRTSSFRWWAVPRGIDSGVEGTGKTGV
jgi:hypothetical protein